jgi:hypothetical protein
MNRQNKLFSLMTTMILIGSLSALSEVAQSYQREISSEKLTEEELVQVMSSILSDVSGNKAKLSGNTFAENLADFYLHNFENDFPVQNHQSFSIKHEIKNLLDKHSDTVLNDDPEPFFQEVLPLLRDYYSHKILVEGNEEETYDFSVLIRHIEDLITIKRQKSAIYDSLKTYVLKSVKLFTQESMNLFSIKNHQELFNLIYDAGARVFNSMWAELDQMEDEDFENNLSKLEELIRAFLKISLDKYANSQEEDDLPNQHALVYYILREAKTSMESTPNTQRRIKLLSMVVKTSADTFYESESEKKANYYLIYLIHDFYTVSSSQMNGKIEKFVAQFMHQKYKKEGLVPTKYNESELKYYWLDIFNKIPEFYDYDFNKHELAQLLEKLDIVFSTQPYQIKMSEVFLDIYKLHIITDSIDNSLFVPLDNLYDFYTAFLAEKITKVQNKSELVYGYQDYLLEVRNKEHPELSNSPQQKLIEGEPSNENMKLGKFYLLFELMLMDEMLDKEFQYKFADTFSKEELNTLIHYFQNDVWVDLRKLNLCIWKKMTNNQLTQDLITDISQLEKVFIEFAGKSFNQNYIDSSLNVVNGSKGC